MTDRFTIRRPETPAEWRVVKDMLSAYESEFDDKTCFTSFEQEMNNIEKLYADVDKVKLIAVDKNNSTIAGCVALREFSPGISEMKRLYVTPAYRGFQLGEQLANAIIAKAKEKKYKTMILDTMMEMKAAQGLYIKLGFYVTPPYNRQDHEKIICFEKRLTD
jgi:putative acetyltransferase